jgi:DNA polymerase
MKQAIRSGQAALGNLTFEFENGTLYTTLPSGRRLAYPEARLVPGKFDDTTAIAFMDNARGGWAEVDEWHGTFTENVISGIGRDLLAAAMLRVAEAGLEIVLTVHDELCIEVLEGTEDPAELERLVITAPAWANGLPLAAKVRVGRRYSKSSKPKLNPQVLELERQALADVDLDEKVYIDDF